MGFPPTCPAGCLAATSQDAFCYTIGLLFRLDLRNSNLLHGLAAPLMGSCPKNKPRRDRRGLLNASSVFGRFEAPLYSPKQGENNHNDQQQPHPAARRVAPASAIP